MFEDDWDGFCDCQRCCSCCGCSCDEEVDEPYDPGLPEPYQQWLFVELAPKSVNEILTRYYTPAINEMLERSSTLFSRLRTIGQMPTPEEYVAWTIKPRAPSQPYLYGV